MHFDVDKHTVFLALSGSHAYGMATSSSDVDIRGVAIPPREVRNSFYLSFDQFTTTNQRGGWGPHSEAALEKIKNHKTAGPCYNGETDLCIYSLTKFVGLAANNNPNILELLFVEDEDILFKDSRWETLREHRQLFLSQKCRHTYTGYAMSQLKRIKGHRKWLLDPPKKAPTRKDFGLPEESVLPADVRNEIDAVVKKTLNYWKFTDGFEDILMGASLDSLVDRVRDFHLAVLKCEDSLLDEKLYELAAARLGLTKDILYAIRQERRYRAAMKHWSQYQTWKKNRNKSRFGLEDKFGYDTKHASHLIRLMRTGLEILRDHTLKVKRDDAKELLEIRNGKWTYDELMEITADLQKEIDETAKKTTLRKSPDKKKIDQVLLSLLD